LSKRNCHCCPVPETGGLEKCWLVLPFETFQSLTIPVLGIIRRHLVHIFGILGNRWAMEKEVGQQRV
jgi:hypothetical protein